MPLSLKNLDAQTRALMLEEIDMAIAAIGGEEGLYLGQRLTTAGRNDFPGLLKQSAEQRDERWLTDQLRSNSRLKAKEERHLKKGVILADVPFSAPETLADGEFNYFWS
jgi:hypothetical protein